MGWIAGAVLFTLFVTFYNEHLIGRRNAYAYM